MEGSCDSKAPRPWCWRLILLEDCRVGSRAHKASSLLLRRQSCLEASTIQPTWEGLPGLAHTDLGRGATLSHGVALLGSTSQGQDSEPVGSGRKASSGPGAAEVQSEMTPHAAGAGWEYQSHRTAPNASTFTTQPVAATRHPGGLGPWLQPEDVGSGSSARGSICARTTRTSRQHEAGAHPCPSLRHGQSGPWNARPSPKA